MNFFRKRMNKKGFTLIELIIVIAILGILAALAIPRFFGFTESAKQAADEELAAVLANAAILYYASEDDVPDMADLFAQDYIEKSYVGADDLQSEKYNETGAGTIQIIDSGTEGFTLDVVIGGDSETFTVTK